MVDNGLVPGSELWSVATGRLSLLRRASRDAARFMGSLDGFVGVNVTPDGRLLWLFGSENAAKTARNRAGAEGIACGSRICRFVVTADGVPGLVDGGASC